MQDDSPGFRKIGEHGGQLLHQFATVGHALELAVVIHIILDVDMNEHIRNRDA
jgi:hypothetical protein